MGKLMALENINNIIDKLEEKGMHTESLHALAIRDGDIHHLLAMVMLMKGAAEEEHEQKRVKEVEKTTTTQPMHGTWDDTKAKVLTKAKVDAAAKAALQAKLNRKAREAAEEEAAQEEAREGQQAREKREQEQEERPRVAEGVRRERKKGHTAWGITRREVSVAGAVASTARDALAAKERIAAERAEEAREPHRRAAAAAAKAREAQEAAEEARKARLVTPPAIVPTVTPRNAPRPLAEKPDPAVTIPSRPSPVAPRIHPTPESPLRELDLEPPPSPGAPPQRDVPFLPDEPRERPGPHKRNSDWGKKPRRKDDRTSCSIFSCFPSKPKQRSGSPPSGEDYTPRASKSKRQPDPGLLRRSRAPPAIVRNDEPQAALPPMGPSIVVVDI